jgi:hypothetical protein
MKKIRNWAHSQKDGVEGLDGSQACGLCFEWGYRYLKDHPEAVLHHGTVREPFSDGPEFPHAWVTQNGIVKDWQTMEAGHGGKYNRRGYPEAVFAELWRPRETAAFTLIEATLASARTGHYGPWEQSDGVEFRQPVIIVSGWYIESVKNKTHIYYGPFASASDAKKAEFFNGPFHREKERDYYLGRGEAGPAGRAFFEDEGDAHYLSTAPEEIFGKGTKIVLRGPSQVKVHPSWRAEWKWWVTAISPMSYAEFQDRNWARIWKNKATG